MYSESMTIERFDPDLARALAAERVRQEEHIELIASENYASPRVMEAQGSQLTNKYAEGYVGKRYYGGCEYVDIAETLARHGVKAETMAYPTEGLGEGQALLRCAADNGADLIVMGAYGHSRLTEFIFGGATRHILSHSPVPVFMAH